MAQSFEAYWISPRGDVIPVQSRHIDTVIANLEKFGMDKKTIDDVYTKHGEQIGVEGNARDEVFIAICKKGWIRLRFNSRQSSWTAQLDQLDKRRKDYLWSWVDGMLEGKYGKASKYTELVVIDLKLKIQYRGNFGDAHQNFFEGKIEHYTKLVMIEDYKEDIVLNETSLSRVWQHVNSNKPLAIMTAYRNEHTTQENKQRNLELSKLVREQGWGYFWVDGYWVEDQGTDKETKVVERSLFIIANEKEEDKLFSQVKKWIKKYNQDAAVVKKAEDKNVFLLFKDGEFKQIGKWTPGKVAQAYSKLKNGRTFVFENAWVEGNVMSRFAKYHSEKSQNILEKLDDKLSKSYNELG